MLDFDQYYQGREYTERWHTRLKAAQRDLIESCGGIMRVADKTTMGKSQVGRWSNPKDRDLMPINAVLLLEGDCGRPLVTSVMADFNGCPLGDREEHGEDVTNLSTHVANMVSQFGELMAETARATEDGVVTATEATQIEAVNRELRRRADQLDNILANVKVAGSVNLNQTRGR